MHRRQFVKACAAVALIGGRQPFAAAAQPVPTVAFARTQLVDKDGKPLKASALSQEEAYLFCYPYRSTPCFLIDLKQATPRGVAVKTNQETDEQLLWSGGVGPNQSIVAYSAICAHQLSYPSRQGSAIRYASSASEGAGGRAGVIVCCAHLSVYDPAAGGKVVSGQATRSLAPIRLEYDAKDDSLYATGVAANSLFDDFFKTYKRDLIAAYGPGVAREEVDGQTAAELLSQYSASQISC